MRHTCSPWIVAMILLFALAHLGELAAQQDQARHLRKLPHYKLTVLPTLGGTFGYAGAVNNPGSVGGNSTLRGDQVVHAFLWKNGAMTDLITLGGPNSWTSNPAHGVNDSSVVSGFSDTSTPDPNGESVCPDGRSLICLPFVWQKGVMTPLPLLGGNNGQAAGINNRGQIVGGAETPTPDNCSFFFLQVEAVVWQKVRIQELPPFPGDPDGFAGAINDKGQVTGTTGCATGNLRAVLWPDGPNGGVIDLGNLGGAVNLGGDINNKTQVVGQADVPGGSHHAFLWTKEDGMQDLGSLPGLPTSFASGINNQGQVVGVSQDANGDDSSSVPFLWQNGVMVDLNTLIHADSPLFLQEAEGVNDRGEIVGFGLLPDGVTQRGFLLIPCDENHPGIEGCDYSMVDASAAAQMTPAVHGPSTGLHPSLMQRTNRYRFPGFGLGPKN